MNNIAGALNCFISGHVRWVTSKQWHTQDFISGWKGGGDSPKTGEEKRERMKNNEKHKILNKKSIKNLKQKLWSAVAILYMTLWWLCSFLFSFRRIKKLLVAMVRADIEAMWAWCIACNGRIFIGRSYLITDRVHGLVDSPTPWLEDLAEGGGGRGRSLGSPCVLLCKQGRDRFTEPTPRAYVIIIKLTACHAIKIYEVKGKEVWDAKKARTMWNFRHQKLWM